MEQIGANKYRVSIFELVTLTFYHVTSMIVDDVLFHGEILWKVSVELAAIVSKGQ